MLDLTRAPEVVGPFVKWLERAGFRVVEENNRDWFNQFVVYERNGVRFEFQVDRGDWTVLLAAPGFSEPRGADVWEAYLDEYEPAGDLSPFEDQLDILTRRFDEAIRAAEEDPTCEAILEEIALDWGRRRLGMTGYEQRDAEALRAAIPPHRKTRPLP